jgi:hypothetical protein
VPGRSAVECNQQSPGERPPVPPAWSCAITSSRQSCGSEVRVLEDRFGLSSLSRRRLKWEVERAADCNGAADDANLGANVDDIERFARTST